MDLHYLKRHSVATPAIVDRRAEGLVMPPVAILGAGCWAEIGRPGVWRLGLRLLFVGRGPACRPIYRDEIGVTFEAAAARAQHWFAGGMVKAIEIWTAQHLADPADNYRD